MNGRLRGVVVGKTCFVRVRDDAGWRGPYDMQRSPAKWACVHCGKRVQGDDERPWLSRGKFSEVFHNACADNGHAPCRACGATLPRLNCGCPREHRYTQCPGKNANHRVLPTHATTQPHARALEATDG